MVGDIGEVFAFIAVWTAVSAVVAVAFGLRHRIPTRRMVVVVRSGQRRRIVAVAGRRPGTTPDRVVAEIDPERRFIVLPRRRVETADTGSPIVIEGRLHYDIIEPDTAARASEPLAVALGDGIITAVDEWVRDLPPARAARSRDEAGRRLLDALTTMRVHGIAVTEVELTTFTVPGGQVWGSPSMPSA